MAATLSPGTFDVRHSDVERLPAEARSGRLGSILHPALQAAAAARKRAEFDTLLILFAIGWALALGLTIAALAAVTATVPPVSTISRTLTEAGRPEPPAGTQRQAGPTTHPAGPVSRRSVAGHDYVSRD